jgi:hypothetical protein
MAHPFAVFAGGRSFASIVENSLLFSYFPPTRALSSESRS